MWRHCHLLFSRLLLLGWLILAGFLAGLLVGDVRAQDSARLVRIHGDETVRIALPRAAEFSLRFAAVVSDERCPVLVTCSWANPPVLTLEASAPGQPTQSFDVTPGGPGGARQGHYLGATIEFADLSPIAQVPDDFAKLKPLRVYTAVVKISAP